MQTPHFGKQNNKQAEDSNLFHREMGPHSLSEVSNFLSQRNNIWKSNHDQEQQISGKAPPETPANLPPHFQSIKSSQGYSSSYTECQETY